MLLTKIKVVLLGLLAVMLVGSVMATVASAEPGPFWHHREIGTRGEGEKIVRPENFEGHGGEQTLTTTFSGLNVVLRSAAVQVKGAISNQEHQGQIKVAIFYQQPKVFLNGVEKPKCIATVGQQGQFTQNAVVVKGHLAWKWDGTEQQLLEQPQRQQKWDIIFTQTEPQEQGSTKPLPLVDLRRAVGTFAEIKFTNEPGFTECGLLGGTIARITGAEVGIPSGPTQLEEWSRTLKLRTIASGLLPLVLGRKVEGEGFLQHIWVGPNGFQPVIAGLEFAGAPANLVGQFETTAEQQEIAVFEK